MIGETISHYRILSKLGRGGMGEVYKAEDTRLRRVVALKFLSPELTLDEDARTRFKHEAQAASALQHHNICTIHEIDRTPDGRMFICMDYYAGDTLKSRIGRGPLPVAEAVDIATQIGDGLARAHTADTVHRDIKPANISITEDGVVKILDFGLARLSDRTRVTKMGTTVGTLAYMSPENTKGETVGPAADVWSLGVILYEMLTGRLPFQANHDTAMMYMILNEPHDPLMPQRPDIPDELSKIVDRALAKDPGGRYEDAGEMVQDLRKLAAHLESKKQESVSPDRQPPRRSKYWMPVAAIAVIVVAVLILRPLLFESDVVSAPRPVAVISFENKTGDAEYDYLCDVIPNLLITSLEQSKYLSVVTWERMHDLLAQAGRADVEIIDREAGFEACRIDGIDTIVLGSFTKAGDVFVTDVKILDVVSKELLKSASARGNGAGSILDSQIDELGREISRGVGLSERKIAAAGALPIANVTTNSLDAYDYFVRGRNAADKRYQADAYRDLKKAVELDSTFAVAWLYLGGVHGYRREVHLMNEAYEKAKHYAATVPEKDRLYIEAICAVEIDNNWDLMERLLVELTSKYPKEKRAWHELGAYYQTAHRFEEAVDAFGKVLSLDPVHDDALNGMAYTYAAQADYELAAEYFRRNAAAHPEDANPHDSLAEMYFKLGRLDEAISAFERALAIKPDFGSQRGIAYVKALREDWDGAIDQMELLIDEVQGAGLKASGRLILAYYYNSYFRWRRSFDLIDEAALVFESVGHQFGLSAVKWQEAINYYALGETRLSRESMVEAEALMRASGNNPAWAPFYSDILMGLLDLKENRLGEAKMRFAPIDSLLLRIAETEPQYHEMGVWSVAVYRAEVLLADGRIEEAITLAKAMPQVTIPNLNPLTVYFYNFPYERDVLARAYVQKGEVDDAIAEYKRLVTFDPDGSDRRLINPLFHYRLGVLYEGCADTDRAIRQYDKFLEICGEADPGLEEIADTRRRLAALDR